MVLKISFTRRPRSTVLLFHTIPLSVFPFPSAPCRKRVVSYPIIAFCCRSFNLSVTASPLRRFRASSPRGRAIGRPDRFLLNEQSFILSGTVVPCGLDSRQLYKARFFRSLCPRKRGPAFCASIRFQRPVQSVPARQCLSLWERCHRR